MKELPTLTQGRQCGTCRLCCKVFRIDTLDKGRGRWCGHASSVGCRIHGQHPQECKDFTCLWLMGAMEDKDRPDLTGLVVMPLVPHEQAPTRIPDPSGRERPLVVVHEGYPGQGDQARAQELVTRILASGYGVVLASTQGPQWVQFPGHPRQVVTPEQARAWSKLA